MQRTCPVTGLISALRHLGGEAGSAAPAVAVPPARPRRIGAVTIRRHGTLCANRIGSLLGFRTTWHARGEAFAVEPLLHALQDRILRRVPIGIGEDGASLFEPILDRRLLGLLLRALEAWTAPSERLVTACISPGRTGLNRRLGIGIGGRRGRFRRAAGKRGAESYSTDQGNVRHRTSTKALQDGLRVIADQPRRVGLASPPAPPSRVALASPPAPPICKTPRSSRTAPASLSFCMPP